jgi:hypothetical protein
LQLKLSGDGHNFEVTAEQPEQVIYSKEMPLVVTALIGCNCNEEHSSTALVLECDQFSKSWHIPSIQVDFKATV